MSRNALAALLAASLAGSAVADGNAACPCKNTASSMSSFLSNGMYSYTIGRTSYSVPTTYGQSCDKHDSGRSPFCSGSSAPAWCQTEWCYVDPNDCAANIVKVESKQFMGSGLYFSYATCAGASGGSKPSAGSSGSWSQSDVQATRKMVELVEQYTRSARNIMEEAIAGVDFSGENVTACEVDEMCPAATADKMPDYAGWGRVDFSKVGTHMGAGSGLVLETAKCMAQEMGSEYTKVGAKELDPDFERVGFLYFGDQQTGSYTSWPKESNTAVCADTYDPRMRPWYAAGASGPKDVLIVVDVSGSMAQENRHILAKKAVKAVLRVLSWKDFVGILLFNGNVYRKYSDIMVPATEDNVADLNRWVDSPGNNWRNGGTNFGAALDGAFEIIKKSVDDGQTSMCQKAILFMTDGKDDMFEDNNFNSVAQQATETGTFIFSYALGTGADTTKPKRLACENQGIYYKVEDGGALDIVMAKFYDYFVQGQEICSASWVKYSAAGSNSETYTGCLPMYDRSSSSGGLMGVTCMDVGLVKKVSDMKQEAGWSHFVCQTSDVTKKCRSVTLTECDRQKMRRAYSADSVCESNSDASATASTVCQCTNANCQDDDNYLDAKQYFCDTWVGDNCEEAASKWGYTQAQQDEIISKCPRSCGKCPLQSTSKCAGERNSPDECLTIQIEEKCRACRGKVSGVDIDGNTMCCPGQDCGANGAGGDTVASKANSASVHFLNYLIALAILRLAF